MIFTNGKRCRLKGFSRDAGLDVLKRVFQCGQAFRMADHQIPARLQVVDQVREKFLLGGTIKIDHHVSAKDDIHAAWIGPTVFQ